MNISSEKNQFICCSECFSNYGLRCQAELLGLKNEHFCEVCNSTNGKKLTKDSLEELAHVFFIRGSYPPESYMAHVYCFNGYQKGNQLNFDFTLDKDAKLIENLLSIGFFLYAPNLWRVGITSISEGLNSNSKTEEDETLKLIENACNTVILKSGTLIFRGRDGEFNRKDPAQYDSPPFKESGKKIRFKIDRSLMYASKSVQTCLYELKINLASEISIACIEIKKPLKLLDFCDETREQKGVTDHEFISHTIRALSLSSSEEAYKSSSKLAQHLVNEGYDGFIYPSYYCRVMSENHENIAIFGRPIEEGFASVLSINRVTLNSINIQYSFGPIY